MQILIPFMMLFMHIVADFYLQGILAKLKQKSWWEENYPQPMYAFDYRIALLHHSFMWSFIVLMPPVIYYTIVGCGLAFYIACLVLLDLNTIVHAGIDDAKANKKTINLTTDQHLHTIQVMVTAIVLIIVGNI